MQRSINSHSSDGLKNMSETQWNSMLGVIASNGARGYGGYSVLHSLTLYRGCYRSWSITELALVSKKLPQLKNLTVDIIETEAETVPDALFQNLDNVECIASQTDCHRVIQLFKDVKSLKITSSSKSSTRYTPIVKTPAETPSASGGQPVVSKHLEHLELSFFNFEDDNLTLNLTAPCLQQLVLNRELLHPAPCLQQLVLNRELLHPDGLQQKLGLKQKKLQLQPEFDSFGSIALKLSPRSTNPECPPRMVTDQIRMVTDQISGVKMNKKTLRVTLTYTSKVRSEEEAGASSFYRATLENILISCLAEKPVSGRKNLIKVLGSERSQKVMKAPEVFAEELRSDSVGELFVQISDSTLIDIFKQLPTQQRLMLVSATCRSWRRLQTVPDLWRTVDLIHAGGASKWDGPRTDLTAFNHQFCGVRGSGGSLTDAFSRINQWAPTGTIKELVLMVTPSIT